MKKIYMAPKTVLVTIRSERHLMDTSIIIEGKSATTSDGYYVTDSRKSSSIWEDEDEDYYE